MKLLTITFFTIVLFSGCVEKTLDDKTYERSNSASEKSLNSLDRDTN
jgi:hypothetical protein